MGDKVDLLLGRGVCIRVNDVCSGLENSKYPKDQRCVKDCNYQYSLGKCREDNSIKSRIFQRIDKIMNSVR